MDYLLYLSGWLPGKNACSIAARVMLARPIALVHEGDPGGRLDFPPCVLAPHTMNEGELPPVQQTSASLEFQSQAETLFCITAKSFRVASFAKPT